MEKPVQRKDTKITPTKPKVSKKKKEIQLKAKHTKKHKNNTKDVEGSEATLVIEKPRFISRKRLPPADTCSLIKLPWNVS
jgi:hypothetical protein